jgi:1,4-dihydroxy-2-naphthoate octaprenyltransferase
MATAAQWIEGARPRTLPAAVAPVLAGTTVAVDAQQFVWWKAGLAMMVALALQVAVNYANDYSDGVRGTDDARVGPLRLVGSGTASPHAVRVAAATAAAIACVAGAVLAATTSWVLLIVGLVAVTAAWFYTGGPRPYGYAGYGELSVFCFFGLVAVAGTAYVQTRSVSLASVGLGAGVGALACAILVVNNLRDAPGDALAGKRTVAVRWGAVRTRQLFVALHTLAYLVLLLGAAVLNAGVLGGFASLPLSLRAVAAVRRGATGSGLIPVLRDTGLTELLYGVGILLGSLAAAWHAGGT